MTTSKSELGSRLVQYVKSIGFHVEWWHPIEDESKHCIVISSNSKPSYLCWHSKAYKDTVSGKKRALRDFTKHIITFDLDDALLTEFWRKMKPVTQAKSGRLQLCSLLANLHIHLLLCHVLENLQVLYLACALAISSIAYS